MSKSRQTYRGVRTKREMTEIATANFAKSGAVKLMKSVSKELILAMYPAPRPSSMTEKRIATAAGRSDTNVS